MTQDIRLTIGADPEFFLFKRGRPVSAHELIPGDKLNPHKIQDGAVQKDGTALEFNIDPCSTPEEFQARIDSVLKQIRKMVPKEYKFKFTPTVKYSQTLFDKLPDTVKELGCDPDFNAFNNGSRNPRPKDLGTMRTGSGHLHLGWVHDKAKYRDITDAGHRFDCVYLVRNLDNFFSSYRHYWDNDTERAKMYGAPGAFRPKPYGVEYRSLSNAWLNYPELWPWIFKNTQAVFKASLESQSQVGRYVAQYQKYVPGTVGGTGVGSYWLTQPKYVTLSVSEQIEETNKHQEKLLGKYGFVPFPKDFDAVEGRNMDEIEDEIYEDDYADDYED